MFRILENEKTITVFKDNDEILVEFDAPNHHVSIANTVKIIDDKHRQATVFEVHITNAVYQRTFEE